MAETEFALFDHPVPQDLKFVGMMQYDGDLLLPANFLVPPPEIHKTSGEYLCHNGISTFACSETQKFGHVTFFWNGNRSGYFDSKLETYLEVRGQMRAALLGAFSWFPYK
jgi:2,3-bisphosphoglycerate-independent phosphoglycerate mutase